MLERQESGRSLREALEKRLGTLPVMQHENGYPVQALPKAELLDLLAAHPAEPVPVVTDEVIESATIAWYEATPGVAWADAGKFERAAMLARTRLILDAAAPLLDSKPPLDREAVAQLVGEAWDDGNAMGLDGWVGPNRGAGQVDPEAERGRERMVDAALALLNGSTA